MMNFLANPKSLFGMWMILGLVLGLYFGFIINSMTIGLPIGLCLSFLFGKVSYRVSRSMLRFRG
ncbi:MAG: hypothetical protein KTR30_11275 [Saprospiraceae bacterium]|nr:hypothetical protein [Saprospiraceae bacterium]